MRRLMMCAVLLATTAIAPATRAQDGQMDSQAMEQLMMKLMTPGQPHALLGKMAGEWTTTVVSYMEGPEPTTSHGTFTSEPVLGGRYMLGRHSGTSMGMPFEGLSIDGYDNGKEEFFSIWLDNFGTGYYLAHGQLDADGRTLRLSGNMTFGPMEIPSRSETVMVDEDTTVFTMWQSMGPQESKVMEMTYKRVK